MIRLFAAKQVAKKFISQIVNQEKWERQRLQEKVVAVVLKRKIVPSRHALVYNFPSEGIYNNCFDYYLSQLYLFIRVTTKKTQNFVINIFFRIHRFLKKGRYATSKFK